MDILRCRKATTNILEVEMDIRNVPFRFVDVGGQRTQRQKWHQCFSDVTAILFIASCADYDEFLREDLKTNRLDEACKVFETLINYKYLKNVEFILFLNKYDLLKEKINKINIKDYRPDFRGDSNSLADVENYLVKKFTVFDSNNHKNEGTSSSQKTRNFNANSNRSNLGRDANNISTGRNYTRYNTGGGGVPTHDQFSSIVPYENEDSSKHSDKAIYSHFTTAIDTNNIKTIFEMVRLMIFEKNCKAIMLN